MNLAKLTVQEKLDLLEEVWDDLCNKPENVPVPEWHKEVLDERERMLQEGQISISDWESAKGRIEKRTR